MNFYSISLSLTIITNINHNYRNNLIKLKKIHKKEKSKILSNF
jgi:hypothetical protein